MTSKTVEVWIVMGENGNYEVAPDEDSALRFRALYLPRKVGLRRSRKAATPSKWSSALLVIANWSTSM